MGYLVKSIPKMMTNINEGASLNPKVVLLHHWVHLSASCYSRSIPERSRLLFQPHLCTQWKISSTSKYTLLWRCTPEVSTSSPFLSLKWAHVSLLEKYPAAFQSHGFTLSDPFCDITHGEFHVACINWFYLAFPCLTAWFALAVLV